MDKEYNYSPTNYACNAKIKLLINDPGARPRGIRKAQADAAFLLICLDSSHTDQLRPNPLFPLQLQHNSHPSKTHRPTGHVQI